MLQINEVNPSRKFLFFRLGDLIAANISSITVYSRNKVFKEGDGVTRQGIEPMTDSGVWLNGCEANSTVSSKLLNSSAVPNTTAPLFSGTLDATKIDELIGQFKSGMTVRRKTKQSKSKFKSLITLLA